MAVFQTILGDVTQIFKMLNNKWTYSESALLISNKFILLSIKTVNIQGINDDMLLSLKVLESSCYTE